NLDSQTSNADPQVEQLLRLNSRLYKYLALMTKLRIGPKGRKQLLPGIKFQKLTETTCKKLTAPLYDFVALMQKNVLHTTLIKDHQGFLFEMKAIRAVAESDSVK
ncbi:hypothetical protein GIB67_017929, partial [Kingdonia uniflora]